MTRVFYVPPPGTPPLTFELGGLHILMPPDQYWKRVREEYTIGIKLHPELRTPLMDATGQPVKIKGSRKVWVPDTEKNAEMEAGTRFPPKNFLDMNESMLRMLARQEFAEMRPYLKREDDIAAEARSSYNEMQIAYDRELAQLRKKKEELIRREKQALEVLESQVQATEASVVKPKKNG